MASFLWGLPQALDSLELALVKLAGLSGLEGGSCSSQGFPLFLISSANCPSNRYCANSS